MTRPKPVCARLNISQPLGRIMSLCFLSLAILSSCAGTTWGQGGPPLITDDPGTPGPGRWEINIASTLQKSRSGRLYELPLIDLNYGIGERVQLKFEVPWVRQHENGRRDHGLGNGLVGVKWRFFEDEHRGIEVSTYPQVEFNIFSLPVEDQLVESGPQLLLPIEITKKFGSIGVNGEVGWRVAPHQTDEWFYGLAIGRQITKRVDLLAEINGESLRAFKESELLLNFGARVRINKIFSLLFSAGRPLKKASPDDPNLVAHVGTQFTF
jgi:hypothetical protein